MKNLLFLISLTLLFAVSKGYCRPISDTMRLQTDSNRNVYYQKVVKVGTNHEELQLYLRAVQFMVAKNFVQVYGDDQEGKLIYTTSQDLNINRVYVGDDTDPVEPYTVQFAITLDLRNYRYRYTINNVVFFIPAGGYNRRLTLYDMYVKATNTYDKSAAKSAIALISSFERYLALLTTEFKQGLEHNAPMYDLKF